MNEKQVINVEESEVVERTPDPEPEKRKIRFSQKDMRLRDYEAFEEVTGLVFSDAIKSRAVRDEHGNPVPNPDDPQGRPLQEVVMSTRVLIGLIYVVERKTNPDVTLDEIRDLTFEDIEFEMEETAPAVDPKAAS